MIKRKHIASSFFVHAGFAGEDVAKQNKSVYNV